MGDPCLIKLMFYFPNQTLAGGRYMLNNICDAITMRTIYQNQDKIIF